MSKFEIFTNEEFGEIRVITINGNPWFEAKDVANNPGYQNGSRDVNRQTFVTGKGQIYIAKKVKEFQTA